MSRTSSVDLQSNENLSDYTVIGIIGTGSFGTCYKVKKTKTNKYYVWKAVDYASMNLREKELLVTEVNLLGTLKHKYIVQYHGRIVHRSSGTLYIIMEWCEKGDLSALIKECKLQSISLSEKFIWKVLYQTARALEACHSLLKQVTVLHRDIKPANIFLDKYYNVKLGDFGLAKILQHVNFSSTIVGTPYYMSPVNILSIRTMIMSIGRLQLLHELQEQIYGSKYNKKSDVWSLGCLIYELCCLSQPFSGCDLVTLRDNIIRNRLSRIPSIYSHYLNQIVKLLLNSKHESRPSVEVIAHHPTVIHNYDANAKPFDTTSHIGNGDTVHHFSNFFKPTNYSEVKELELGREDANDFKITQQLKLLQKKELILNAKENELKTRELLLQTRETTLERKQIQIEKREREIATLQRVIDEQKLIPTNRRSKIDVHLDSPTCSVDTTIMPTATKLDPEKIMKPMYFRKEYGKLIEIKKSRTQIRRCEDGILRQPFLLVENNEVAQMRSNSKHIVKKCQNSVLRR